MSGVAIVGAGIAGLACAGALAAAGATVALFDKGRVPGGRVATRRTRAGLAFDHGAQYATARDPFFRDTMDGLRRAGAAATWDAAGRGEAWVGVPAMASLPERMAIVAGAALHMQRHAAFLHAGKDGWRVRHLDAAETAPGTVLDSGGVVAGPFEAVVLAMPAPQAAPLLAAIEHGFADRLGTVKIAPCWALMAAFDAPVAAPDVLRPEAGLLAWAAREGAKPGRLPFPDRWVAHATPAWSRDNLERAPEDVADDLARALAALIRPEAAPAWRAAHRWRYAMTETPLGTPFLWDAEARLGVCGDFCLGARVEAAWQSGTALAAAMRA